MSTTQTEKILHEEELVEVGHSLGAALLAAAGDVEFVTAQYVTDNTYRVVMAMRGEEPLEPFHVTPG